MEDFTFLSPLFLSEQFSIFISSDWRTHRERCEFDDQDGMDGESNDETEDENNEDMNKEVLRVVESWHVLSAEESVKASAKKYSVVQYSHLDI